MLCPKLGTKLVLNVRLAIQQFNWGLNKVTTVGQACFFLITGMPYCKRCHGANFGIGGYGYGQGGTLNSHKWNTAVHGNFCRLFISETLRLRALVAEAFVLLAERNLLEESSALVVALSCKGRKKEINRKFPFERIDLEKCSVIDGQTMDSRIKISELLSPVSYHQTQKPQCRDSPRWYLCCPPRLSPLSHDFLVQSQ